MLLNSTLKLQLFQKCIKTQFENLMKLSSSCLRSDFSQTVLYLNKSPLFLFQSISSADTSSCNIWPLTLLCVCWKSMHLHKECSNYQKLSIVLFSHWKSNASNMQFIKTVHLTPSSKDFQEFKVLNANFLCMPCQICWRKEKKKNHIRYAIYQNIIFLQALVK